MEHHCGNLGSGERGKFSTRSCALENSAVQWVPPKPSKAPLRALYEVASLVACYLILASELA